MSTKTGIYKGHKFHGDPQRFEVVADFVFDTFGRSIEYIADVAGGRGMLSRILNKKYNYKSTVFDPRGYTLVGVESRLDEFKPEDASYYDLVIGLHPDEATHVVVESALVTNTIVIPCCNFWDQSRKLGRNALIEEISKYYKEKGIRYQKVEFDFKGPKNIGLVSFYQK
jgi:hypothetical protein